MILAVALLIAAPALAVEVWPDPDLTGGSVRMDGHSPGDVWTRQGASRSYVCLSSR